MSARYVAAVAVVIRRGERVLALRRAAHREAGAGLWETVSGRLEAGEAPLDAAIREVAEETALGVEIDPRPVDAYIAERAGAPMLVVVYRGDWREGRVRRSEEHDAHAWLGLTALARRGMPPRLHEAVRRALASGRG